MSTFGALCIAVFIILVVVYYYLKYKDRERRAGEMITDNSGIPTIGLALLRNNLDRLPKPKVHLTRQGSSFLFVVVSQKPDGDMFKSVSFAWGDDSPKSTALNEALSILGIPMPGKLISSQDYIL